MQQPSQRRETRDAQEFAVGSEARAELAAGLAQPAPQIAPKYFYNALGSKLFEAICQLDEYYLTRVEASIFRANGAAIARAAGEGGTLIDLGAGNCVKAASLFSVLRPKQYVPVDISAEFLHEAVEKLRAAHSDLPMLPVGLDFTETLLLPPRVERRDRLFFYPGSSLGNFAPLAAAQFLSRIRSACLTDGLPGGGLLIGIDLVKDHATLEAAYDDALGVTAAFNLNALRHVNDILGADFDVRHWRHRALFNPEQSRIEMYLEAAKPQTVRWPGAVREFSAGARIHTENSYKYTKDGVVKLLESAGFGDIRCWSDSGTRFLVCHARAV